MFVAVSENGMGWVSVGFLPLISVPTGNHLVVAACNMAICLRNSTIWFQLEIIWVAISFFLMKWRIFSLPVESHNV
jgi:hypothetical protein